MEQGVFDVVEVRVLHQGDNWHGQEYDGDGQEYEEDEFDDGHIVI